MLDIESTHAYQWIKKQDMIKEIKNGLYVVPLYTEKEEEDVYLLPMKSVQIKGKLEGGLAILDIELTYLNENERQALECTYEFLVEQSTIVGHLTAKLDNREIVTKITEKQKANEIYEDAIAGNKFAVMAQRES